MIYNEDIIPTSTANTDPAKLVEELTSTVEQDKAHTEFMYVGFTIHSPSAAHVAQLSS